MCRFTCYIGDPVLMKQIVIDPPHAVITMACEHTFPGLPADSLMDIVRLRKRNHGVNVDGFGIGVCE